MYQNYEVAVNKVMDYLASNNYTSSIVYTHKRCYRLLKEYLELRQMSYSRELAQQWLDTVTLGLCSSTLKNYRRALSRIDDALNHHEIQNTKNAYEAAQHYQHLEFWSKELLDEFLSELSKSHGSGSIQQHRIANSRFLEYLSQSGLKDIGELSHYLIKEYYRYDIHKTQKIKDRYNSLNRHFLKYLADKGMIKASIPLTLDKFVLRRLFFIGELPAKEKECFSSTGSSDYIAPWDFYSRTLLLGSTHLQCHRYSKTIISTFRRIWSELFVFLEANELDYYQELALSVSAQ